MFLATVVLLFSVSGHTGSYNQQLHRLSGDWDKQVSVSFQAELGWQIQAQCIRSHDKRSTEPLRAYVSEANVLPTTLAIFREYHMRGLTRLDCHSPICFDAAKIRQPFCD